MSEEEEAMPEAEGEAEAEAPFHLQKFLAQRIGEEELRDEEQIEEEGGSEESSSSSSSPSEGAKEAAKIKMQLMREYMELIGEIDAQNRMVKELKEQICQKCQKSCMTKCEEREIKSLRCCLEKENLKLQCLLKKAMTLQEEDSSETWEEIPITTTLEEDGMPIGLSYNVMKSVCKKSFSDDDDDSCRVTQKSKPCRDEKDSKTELERYLRCLLQKVKKTPCDKRMKSDTSVCNDDGTMLALDDETIKKIMCALQCQAPPDHKHKGKKKKDYSKVCKELHRSYSMQERLVQENSDLEGDRFKLQEEMLGRDRMIECLQQKIQVMQCELQKLCREKQKIMKETSKTGGNITGRTQERVTKFKDWTKSLQRNIDCMQGSVERMKLEMNSLKKERDQWQCQVSSDNIHTKKKTRAAEIEELKRNYTNLLTDYCKKENELKEMQQRTKGFIGNGGQGAECNTDSVELDMLKERMKDLQEEQDEFKCIIKEQADQVDDYRNKYLIAQQRVEEQKCMIEKLEMNNKRIEDQINMEIQRIKSKFQEKLMELAQLPKLLENEQLKLATACKEKQDLEQKLRLVCKELKTLKAQLNTSGGDDGNIAEKLRQVEHDYALLQKKYDDLKADNDLILARLQKTEEDLDYLRTESARIIARTKERAENQREILQNRIDKLEKELAQCRATSCFSISDREAVIKEMKGQLSTLSYSFDSAQKQIKTLKNHIAFLANEKSYPC